MKDAILTFVAGAVITAGWFGIYTHTINDRRCMEDRSAPTGRDRPPSAGSPEIIAWSGERHDRCFNIEEYEELIRTR